MNLIRPMLAYGLKEEDLSSIRFPIYVQQKLDGIRCLVIDGKPFSRTLKPIPNIWIRQVIPNMFGHHRDDHFILDGELIVGNSFQETSSAVMSENGKPKFKYKIFDFIRDFNKTFENRLIVDFPCLPHEYKTIDTLLLNNLDQLKEMIRLHSNWEGLILRSPDGIYKQGRSTLKEQYLLKWKFFQDSEAVIVGYVELMKNTNSPTVNFLGLQERSSHIDNLVPMDTLGALQVKDCKSGIEFRIGSGFTEQQRLLIWNNRGRYFGQTVKYKYQSFGMKDLPRSPVFLGFRHKEDIL
jgi:ATP-dependent DNA ligase